MTSERFGPYELVRLIGRGGMGEVFEAYDTDQDRAVALKRLVPHLAHDQEFQHRFRRESRLAARLRSPHVVPVHRFGEIERQLYIDMRLVDGCDLEQLLAAEGRLTPSHAVAITEQVAWALDAAHHAGLIHRDVKPSNVLIDNAAVEPEFVYLTDFGITLAVGDQSVSLTSPHAVLGSLDYMAPEQFDGLAAATADVYSLGGLLFHCLTGVKPFPFEGFPAMMRAHLSTPAPLPSQLGDQVNEAFDEVIALALAKDPGQRYASAGALALAARAALAASSEAVPATSEDPAVVLGDGEPLAGADVPSRHRGKASADLATAAARGNTEHQPSATVGQGFQPGNVDEDSDSGAGEGSGVDGLAGAKARTVNGRLRAAGTPTVAEPLQVDAATAPPDGRISDPGPPPSPTSAQRLAASPVALSAGARGEAGPPKESASPQPDAEHGSSAAEPPTRRFGGQWPPNDGWNSGARPTRAYRRRPVLLGVGTLLVLAMLIAVGWSGWRSFSASGHGSGTAHAAPAPPPPLVARSVPVPSLGSPIPVDQTPGFAAVSRNGQQVYVANQDAGVVTVVDTSVNQVTATIPVPAGPPQYLSFAPDGKHIYISVFNDARTIHTVSVLDTSTNEIVANIPQPARPFLGAVTPDGRQLWMPNHDTATISVIDTATNTVIREIPVAPNPHWIAFSRDGSRAYTANHESNLVSVIDTASYRILAQIPVDTSPHSVAVHPSLPLVANVNYDADTVTMIDTNTNKVVARIPVGHNPQDITWAPDGRFAYVANNGGNTVSVIDAQSMQVTATLPTPPGPTSVAVTPDGRTGYVSCTDGGAIAVLNLAG